MQYDVATDTTIRASTHYDTDLGDSFDTDLRNPHFSNNGDFLTFQSKNNFYPTDPTNRYQASLSGLQQRLSSAADGTRSLSY